MKRAIGIRYLAFAVVATFANFAAQAASLLVYKGQFALMASIIAGTGVGFALKYILDKRYIFFDTTSSVSHEVQKVWLYGLTAVATTIIFWGAELGAFEVTRSEVMKYAGGAVGLAIGYTVKYSLDRHFVFGKAGRP